MDHLKNIECYKNALTRMYQGDCRADDYYLMKSLIDDLDHENNRHEFYKHEYFSECDLRERLEKENEILKRENKALEDDNYQKCLKNEELSDENKKLLKLNDQLVDRIKRLEDRLL